MTKFPTIALAVTIPFLAASTAGAVVLDLSNNVCPTGADWVEGGNGDFSNDETTPTIILTTNDSYTICGMMGQDFGDSEDYLSIPNFYGKRYDLTGASELQSLNGLDVVYETLPSVDNQNILWAENEVFSLSFDHTNSSGINLFYTYTFSLSDVQAVPLPASALLLFGGLSILGATRRRSTTA